MISGIIEWTMSWLKQTHKKTNKKLWVSQLQALHNDAVLFLSVCKLFVLALFLWGAVMPCCSAHIFSTQSPLSIWTHLITILISATPHFVYPHCLRSTLSFSRLTISEAATFCIYCLVWSLIWHRVALQAALLHCFQDLRVWKPSEGAGRGFLITGGSLGIWTNDNGLLSLPCGKKRARELRQKQICAADSHRPRRVTEHSLFKDFVSLTHNPIRKAK